MYIKLKLRMFSTYHSTLLLIIDATDGELKCMLCMEVNKKVFLGKFIQNNYYYSNKKNFYILHFLHSQIKSTEIFSILKYIIIVISN